MKMHGRHYRPRVSAISVYLECFLAGLDGIVGVGLLVAESPEKSPSLRILRADLNSLPASPNRSLEVALPLKRIGEKRPRAGSTGNKLQRLPAGRRRRLKVSPVGQSAAKVGEQYAQ